MPRAMNETERPAHPPRKRVAVLISGRGSNMMSLVEAARAPDYPAEICLVVSNRPDAAGLAWAKAQGIPAVALDHKLYSDRAHFDGQLHALLTASRIEIVALAGFMRLLTADFVAKWTGRMINIHPALLPAFKGLDTHARALAAGVRIAGCTVHFVSAGVDEGAIIAQAAVPVLPADTPGTLAARILTSEHKLYPLALQLLAFGQVRLDGDQVWIDQKVNHKLALISPIP
ncbi:MAG: phosphoribosylglycinamide formyltransferase [Pseudomonadota bacterium]